MPAGYFTLLLFATSIVTIFPGAGHAQSVGGCVTSQLGNPARVVYTCANGLVIEAEAAADLRIDSGSSTSRPGAVSLSSDAVLVELPSASGPFQILTPHAIASVRGTVYAVDVNAARTSVFVVRGEVSVGPATGPGEVTLGPGEGIEVSPGAALEVKRWPAEKVSRLLARFGR